MYCVIQTRTSISFLGSWKTNTTNYKISLHLLQNDNRKHDITHLNEYVHIRGSHFNHGHIMILWEMTAHFVICVLYVSSLSFMCIV